MGKPKKTFLRKFKIPALDKLVISIFGKKEYSPT